LKGRSGPSGDLSGFLDRETVVHGEIVFKETLRVDGKVQGALRGGKNLVIGEDAQVSGEIEVAALYISGRFDGKIRATERVEIQRTARVQAELLTPVLIVEEGAWFEGSCSMDPSRATAAPQPKAIRPVPLKGA
jgi:cytoskeletal protein CcmA (bactofilin family)